jgi:predicted N-acetyltransferase YhbS
MLRTATENEAPLIRALIESVPGLWHAAWRPDAIERAIRAADGLAFVWDEGGRIVGFVCAHDVGFLGYLSLLVVADSARGQGIGAKLVRHTERALAARGCATLISDVWKDAAGFYQRLGWSAPDAILLRHKLDLGQSPD